MHKLFFMLAHLFTGALLILGLATIQHVKVEGIPFEQIPLKLILMPIFVGSILGAVVGYFRLLLRAKSGQSNESNQQSTEYEFSPKQYLRTYLEYWVIAVFIVLTFASVQIFVVSNKELDVSTARFFIVPLLIATVFGYLLANSKLLMMKFRENIQLIKQRDELLHQHIIELEATRKQMIESETMASLGRLVAGVAHEINTPVGNALTAVTHYQSVMNDFQKLVGSGLRKQDLTEFLAEAAEASEIIQLNLQRAGKLVQSFKQIAVDESHDEMRDFVLGDYVAEVLLSLKPKLKHSNVEIQQQIDSKIAMNTNAGAIAQIVTNLVENALLHAFEEGSNGLITISANVDKGMATLLFRDNGRGISQENLHKVFEPFFTTANHKGGTGLGLNLIYNLVTHKLKGTVTVDSVLQQGTTFTIQFPTHPENDA